MKLTNEILQYLKNIKENEFKDLIISRFNTKIKYYIDKKKNKNNELQAFYEDIKEYGNLFSMINYYEYSKKIFEGMKTKEIRDMLCFVFDIANTEI